MIIHFWNTTVETDTDIATYSDEELLEFLQSLITFDTWNNGGQLVDGTNEGAFYDMVVAEILRRMKGHA